MTQSDSEDTTMSRLFYEEKAVPTPTKLLLGLALLLLVPFAVAQNNLGELLDAGARKLSAEEFRQEVTQHVLLGVAPTGMRMEVMYGSSGVIQGSSSQYTDTRNPQSNVAFGPIDGVWTVDDSGRTCTSVVIGRTFLPFRCQFWFKYKEDY